MSRKRWLGASFITAVAIMALVAAPALAAPVVSPVPVSATEGAQFSGNVATFTDLALKGPTCQPPSSYSATIDWGDNTSTSASTITGGTLDNGGLCDYTVSGSHTYADEFNGKFDVVVVAPGPSNGSASGALTVSDAPLTLSGNGLGATAGTAFSGQVAMLTDASASAPSSDFTATIDWGDGSSSAGTVAGGGPFSVVGSHTYNAPGNYSVKITVNDDGGSQKSATVSLTVAPSTPPPVPKAPLVTTGSATLGSDATTGAVLNGTVDPQATPVTDCHFDFGLTDSYGTSLPCSSSPGSGSGAVGVSAQTGALQAGSTYHYRLVATSTGGTTAGQDGTFAAPGNTPGFSAAIELAAGSDLSAGGLITFIGQATLPPGYQVYAYEWAFDTPGQFTANTGPYNSATHRYTTGGLHTVTLQVDATDASGEQVQTTTHYQTDLSSTGLVPGCQHDLKQGWLEFLANCISDDNGKYKIKLDGGVDFAGLLLTGAHGGETLTLDTTGSSGGTHNPDHHWTLSADGPVALSIQNTPIGTIQVYQWDLLHSPLVLPLSAQGAPDQNAPGIRLFTVEVQHDCGAHAAVPPVVCAQLPGGFPLEGGFSVDLTPPLAGENPGVSLEMTAHLRTPIDITGTVALTGDVTGVNLDHMGLSTQGIHFGSLATLDPTSFTYDALDHGDHNVWTATLAAHLNVPASHPGFGLTVRLANGGFQRASAYLTGALNIGPVSITTLSGGFGINPFQVQAGIGGTIGPLGITVGVLYRDAWMGQPWHFQLGVADPNNNPDHVTPLSVTYLHVLQIGGALDVYGDGFLSGDVTVRAGLPSLDADHPTLSAAGEIAGWFQHSTPDIPHDSWEVLGSVSVAFNTTLLSGSGTVGGFANDVWSRNSGGALQETHLIGGCGQVRVQGVLTLGVPITAGVWVRHDFNSGDTPSGFGGCDDITPYCVAASAGHNAAPCSVIAGIAAASPRPQRIQVAPGEDVANLLIRSDTGQPEVRVSGPSGTVVTSAQATMSKRYYELTSASGHDALVALFHPKPGIYTVNPLPGSPAIEPVADAHTVPSPDLRVRVTGHGRARVLQYSMRPAPGQTVQFAERARDVMHFIGIASAAHGTIRFTTQDAVTQRRNIVATVYEYGEQQRPVNIGTYTAPPATKVGRVRKVTVERRRNRAVITWSRVTGATGYEVLVIRTTGQHDLYQAGTHRSLSLDGVYPGTGARISVTAVGGESNRPGPPRAGRLRA